MAIKVVVAGLGGRGRDWVREVRREPLCELAACVDTNEQVLRQASRELQLPHAQSFLSLEEALHTPSDAVIIATSPESHARECELALSKGRAVLVEKPFTTNLSDAIRLVRLSEERGAPLLVAQNYRYMRAFRTARRLIMEGALGRVGMVICQYYRVPHEMPESLARLQHSVIWGNGIHHLDSLRYVLNQKITRVLADSFTLGWGAKLPRGASFRALLELEEGARALYSATYESSGHEFFERGQEFYARFTGERATLHVFHRWLVLCERGRWPRIVRRGRRSISEERVLLQQLEQAISTGALTETSGRDNLQTIATVEACIRSAEEGRWINPQEILHGAYEPQEECLGHRH
jgi:predicted dehydrogenase